MRTATLLDTKDKDKPHVLDLKTLEISFNKRPTISISCDTISGDDVLLLEDHELQSTRFLDSLAYNGWQAASSRDALALICAIQECLTAINRGAA